MPYKVVPDSSDCPKSKGYAVVKSATGEVVGCHETSSQAEEQISALYASENLDDSNDSYNDFPGWEGTIAVEGERTGDGRQFDNDALTWAELPIPLRWNKEDSHGGVPHTVAVNVGRIDKVWRDGSRIMGSGVFNTGEEDGRRAYELVKGQFLKGISVDVDDITDADIEFVWADNDESTDTDDTSEADLFDALFAQPEFVIFHSGRIRAATLCDIPAFVDAAIALSESPGGEDMTLVAAATPRHSTATTDETWDAGANLRRLASPASKTTMDHMFAWLDTERANADGTYPKGAGKFPHHVVSSDGSPGAANMSACSAAIGALHGARGGASIPEADARGVYNHLASHMRDGDKTPPDFTEKNLSFVASLVAHGAPDWTPSHTWFNNPNLSVPTGLTVSDDGRVYGHAAKWGDCHLGHNACITPPKEDSFPYFLTGELVCDDGTLVSVGQITLGTGHAALNLDSARAAEHYDNTGTAVADVTVGSDKYGIWVAGAIRPDVPSARVRELRASGQLSGDWRRIGGKLRLVGLLAVNVPGFPVPKMTSRVASGQQLALVAAGHVSLRPRDLEEYYMQRALRTLADHMAERVHRE